MDYPIGLSAVGSIIGGICIVYVGCSIGAYCGCEYVVG